MDTDGSAALYTTTSTRPGDASDDRDVSREEGRNPIYGCAELHTDKVVMTAMTHPLRTRGRPLTSYNSPCPRCEGIHQGSCRRHIWSTVIVTISVGVFCFIFAVAVVGSVVGQ